MAHRGAKLTVFGRQLLVQRITELGWPVATAAESLGVSRATAYKWLARWRADGQPGLADRSSRPHRCPHALDRRQVQRILRARRRTRYGPHRLGPALGHPRSTVYGVLRRHSLNRLGRHRPAHRRPRALLPRAPRRAGSSGRQEARARPARGGHRKLGRAQGRQHRAAVGYEHVHSLVDDCSRVAYSAVYDDEGGQTSARFLAEAAAFFADHVVRLERVLTDKAKAYTESMVFTETAAGLGIRLKRTRPYRPQTNGKVERYNRTLLTEWAYTRLYRSNADRRRALGRFLDFYNHRRPHTALGGLTPMAVLVNNVDGNHS